MCGLQKTESCCEITHIYIYILPNFEDIAPKLAGLTVFSTLDAVGGFFLTFWEILFHQNSHGDHFRTWVETTKNVTEVFMKYSNAYVTMD